MKMKKQSSNNEQNDNIKSLISEVPSDSCINIMYT